MDQLYLMEVLVNKITYLPATEPKLTKKELNIIAMFGNYIGLEIRCDGPEEEGEEANLKLRALELNSGKSYLFPANSEELFEALKRYPLYLSVGDLKNFNSVGITIIPWNKQFLDLAKSSAENLDDATPAVMKNIYKLKNSDSGDVVGYIELYGRLTCMGKSIQTQFQVMPAINTNDGALANRKFLFKSNNATTTFQAQQKCEPEACSKGSHVAPSYETRNMNRSRSQSPQNVRNPVYNPNTASIANSRLSDERAFFC